jgi:tetratricopeptide (TPR) repeat protein/predicted Ser/Thr protein kinase
VTDETWASVEVHFEALRQLTPEERAAGLGAITDDEVRREVASLLNHSEGTEGLATVVGSVAAGLDPAVPGERLGAYRLLRRLGHGGQGTVFEAVRDDGRFEQRTAIKIVKWEIDSEATRRRFREERQILAGLEHPYVARLLDGGETQNGAPYLVMEFVDGLPLIEATEGWSMRRKLELFLKVAAGVAAAHRKLIVHRDLKPGNILVTKDDNPKLLDFGIAKLLDAGGDATQTVFQLLTPAYASPEQVRGMPISTASDVYSLGIVLYQLLTGRKPYRLQTATPLEMDRVICQEPPAPADLDSELDAILAMALRKEPERRYQGMEQFAEDVRRYLENRPILARPDTFGYRSAKFLRRNRLTASVAAGFILVLIAAAAVTIRQGVRANREAAVAQAVNDFLQNDLLAQASSVNQADASAKPDPHLEVRTALDRAAARIQGKFDRQPEVEAAIRGTIGQTYLDLGLYPAARTQLDRALNLFRRTLGPENPQTLATLRRLGNIAKFQGNYAEAEALLTQAFEKQRQVLGREHPDTLSSMTILGSLYVEQGKYGQAEALDQQILEIRRRLLGPEHPNTLTSMNNLAIAYVYQGKYPQAEEIWRQFVEVGRRVLGPDHPDTLAAMNNLSVVYQHEGKYGQAEALNSQVVEIRRRLMGPEHPNTLTSMSNLAILYSKQGKYAEAETLNSQVVEIRRRLIGPEHPNTLNSMNNLANVYSAQGRYMQAEKLFAQLVEIRRRVLGPEHPITIGDLANLASVYGNQGKYVQAEALDRQVVEIRKRVLGPEHAETISTFADLAFIYQREGEYAQAETYASQAVAGLRHALGAEHPDTMAAMAELALALVSQGRFAAAEPRARDAVEINRKMWPDSWQRFRAESLLGASLAGQKKYAEAEPLLLEGYQGMVAQKDRIAIPDRYHLERSREWIVQLYEAWGKAQKAAEWGGK